METNTTWYILKPRIEIVHWIAENKRPFAIVKDHGFRDLMKTKRPKYQLPSPATVTQDVKHVFVSMWSLLAIKLKANKDVTYYSWPQPELLNVKALDGSLSFVTDAWTSPNGRAYITMTIHLEIKGNTKSLLLDIMECACSHTRPNLASTFVKVLKDFGISDKVCSNKKNFT
jgi:hypothetical protein